jgi:prolyl 4-hydroxylase
MLTGLLYLQNAEEGGETYFTKLDMRVKPDVGDVLLFWNTNSDGSIVLASEHAGSPPTKGDKWVATKWIRWGLYQTKDAELKGISPQQLSEERAGSVFS